MKIIQVEQNSLEWLLARSGVVTASECDSLFTGKMEPRRGQMPTSYLAQKLAERWIGGPLPGFQTLDMQFGQILEQEAIPYYEFMFNETVQRVGLITTDDGKLGCSPDALIGLDGGLEAKCPNPDTHCKYLLAGCLPEIYAPQVYVSLFVTGRKFWRFLSYRRKFPAFVITIERDEKINAVIEETLYDFCDKLDAGFKRLCEMNGGPPARQQSLNIAAEPVENPDLTP